MKPANLMLDIIGYDVSDIEREILAHPFVGGVILFARNYHDRAQLCELTRQIRAASKSPILIAVDQEGGRVQRFIDGFSKIPPMAIFESIDNETEQLSAARNIAWLMANELIACDIDISFAPVLDLNRDSQVIGHRSFSADPQQVVKIASAFIDGMKNSGMKVTGKHFPGHGSVVADSHIAMPIDSRKAETIFNLDMWVFKSLIANNKLDALMPAHVIYPDIDNNPAGFSKIWIEEILGQQLGFKGTIFSDDLSMHAADFAGGYVNKAHAALSAGCNMILVCNEPEGAIEVIDASHELLAYGQLGADNMFKQKTVDYQTLVRSDKWLAIKAKAEQLNEQANTQLTL